MKGKKLLFSLLTFFIVICVIITVFIALNKETILSNLLSSGVEEDYKNVIDIVETEKRKEESPNFWSEISNTSEIKNKEIYSKRVITRSDDFIEKTNGFKLESQIIEGNIVNGDFSGNFIGSFDDKNVNSILVNKDGKLYLSNDLAKVFVEFYVDDFLNKFYLNENDKEKVVNIAFEELSEDFSNIEIVMPERLSKEMTFEEAFIIDIVYNFFTLYDTEMLYEKDGTYYFDFTIEKFIEEKDKIKSFINENPEENFDLFIKYIEPIIDEVYNIVYDSENEKKVDSVIETLKVNKKIEDIDLLYNCLGVYKGTTLNCFVENKDNGYELNIKLSLYIDNVLEYELEEVLKISKSDELEIEKPESYIDYSKIRDTIVNDSIIGEYSNLGSILYENFDIDLIYNIKFGEYIDTKFDNFKFLTPNMTKESYVNGVNKISKIMGVGISKIGTDNEGPVTYSVDLENNGNILITTNSFEDSFPLNEKYSIVENSASFDYTINGIEGKEVINQLDILSKVLDYDIYTVERIYELKNNLENGIEIENVNIYFYADNPQLSFNISVMNEEEGKYNFGYELNLRDIEKK